MAKKNRTFMMNRKQYNMIKKMDHYQMSVWVETVYKKAFEEGQKSAEGLNEQEMKETLLSVRGIGEIKAMKILDALKKALEEKKPRKEA